MGVGVGTRRVEGYAGERGESYDYVLRRNYAGISHDGYFVICFEIRW